QVSDFCTSAGGTLALNANYLPRQDDQDRDGAGGCDDKCPTIPNPGQEGAGLDGRGETGDNRATGSNPTPADSDKDGFGDACQTLAPAKRVGPEFHVNTFTTNIQSLPAIAADAAGNFVVVWQSRGQEPGGGYYGDAGGIFGQRFDSAGAARGS